MTASLTPMHDVVIIEPLSPEASKRIIVPKGFDPKVRAGIVTHTGPGFRDKKGRLHPLDVQVGDRVLFGAWFGETAQVEGPHGKKYLAIREKDLLGIEQGVQE